MPLEIEVNSVGGRTTISGQCSWLIHDVKQAIAEARGISVHRLSLSAGARTLVDSDGLPPAIDGVVQLTLALRNAEQQCWYNLARNMQKGTVRPGSAASCLKQLMGGSDGIAKLALAPGDILADYEIMLIAAKRNLRSLDYAAPELLSNPTFILGIASQFPAALNKAAKPLWDDPDFVLAALEWDWRALENAADFLRKDPVFVAAATRRNKWALHGAAEELKANEYFVKSVSEADRRQYILDSVKSDGRALQRARDLQKDPLTVKAAVKQSGSALRFACSDLQADTSIVRTAIDNCPHALQWAAPELRADRDIVFAALQKSGETLRWAAPELRADPLLCHAARQNQQRPLSALRKRRQPASRNRSVCSNGSAASAGRVRARQGAAHLSSALRRTNSATALRPGEYWLK